MKDLWYRFSDTWDESRGVRLILKLVLIVGFMFTGVRFYQTLIKGDEEYKEVAKEEQEGSNEEAYGKLPEEFEHIFENPERYDEGDLERAYQVALTTFDDEFVENNVFDQEELDEGIYLYHEKVSPHYKEVARLAEEISNLGVTVYFYSPQNDQTIAALSQLVNLLNEEGTEMIKKAVIVRGEDDIETMEEEGEVMEYLEGVIDANRE